MRYIFLILLFTVNYASGQIISASAPYRTFTTSGGSGGTYLLDSFITANSAYSLRKLNSSYPGSAVRIRESGGNTESDIGFLSSGFFDTTSFKTFVGANSGYVVTWYDQSGNGNNVTQSTTGNQPLLTLNSKGNIPGIVFDGSNDVLDGGDINDFMGLYLNNYIVATPTATNWGLVNKSYASGVADRYGLIRDASVLYNILMIQTGSDLSSSSAFSATTIRLFEQYMNKQSDSNQLKANNTQLSAYTSSIIDFDMNSTYSFLIGGYNNSSGACCLSGYYFTGPIYEVVIYRKKWEGYQRSAITNNINNHYSAY